VTAAQASATALHKDPAFVARFNSADPAVRQAAYAESQAVNRAAFPGDQSGDEVSVGVGVREMGEPGAFGPAPANPGEYRFTYMRPPDAEEAVVDAELRAFCHAAGFDNSLASQLHSTLAKAAQRQPGEQPPTEASVDLEARATEARLRRLWGDAVFEAKVGSARTFLKGLGAEKYGWWLKTLERVPALGNDPLLLSRIAGFAEQRASGERHGGRS
jgi:hypothetical protein